MTGTDVEPTLPAGVHVVRRGPGPPDPAVADENGLLRRQGRGGVPEGILPAPGANRPGDGRVAPTSGSAS